MPLRFGSPVRSLLRHALRGRPDYFCGALGRNRGLYTDEYRFIHANHSGTVPVNGPVTSAIRLAPAFPNVPPDRGRDRGANWWENQNMTSRIFLLFIVGLSLHTFVQTARAQQIDVDTPLPLPQREYETTEVFGFEIFRHEDLTEDDVQYTMHQLRSELWLIEQHPLEAKEALRDYARILLHHPNNDPTGCEWFCWRYPYRSVVIVDHRKDDGYPSTGFRETALIHELAHAWHSRIWDIYWITFDINLDDCLNAALNRAKFKALMPDLSDYDVRHLRKLNRHETGSNVLGQTGTPLYDGHPYWAVNRNEFFAEMSSAFLGRHSMYPRNRVDLFEWDEAIAQTIADLWQTDDLSPAEVNDACRRRLWTTWY